MTTLSTATERHRHTENPSGTRQVTAERWRNAGVVSMEELSNLLKLERAPLVHYNLMQTAGKPKLHLATKHKIL